MNFRTKTLYMHAFQNFYVNMNLSFNFGFCKALDCSCVLYYNFNLCRIRKAGIIDMETPSHLEDFEKDKWGHVHFQAC